MHKKVILVVYKTKKQMKTIYNGFGKLHLAHFRGNPHVLWNCIFFKYIFSVNKCSINNLPIYNKTKMKWKIQQQQFFYIREHRPSMDDFYIYIFTK